MIAHKGAKLHNFVATWCGIRRSGSSPILVMDGRMVVTKRNVLTIRWNRLPRGARWCLRCVA